MSLRHILSASGSAVVVALALAATSSVSIAQPADAPASDTTMRAVVSRAVDTSVTQKWTSEYGYSLTLPATAKYNKIGSIYNAAGRTEKVNFTLPGGNGAITVTYFTEPRMVPKNYRTLDSAHFYQYDSAGRNGMIHRRVYVLRENAIHVDVLLTEKGEKTYGHMVPAIFDSFLPPPNTVFALESWRYGRKESEYENGRYGAGTGPDGR